MILAASAGNLDRSDAIAQFDIGQIGIPLKFNEYFAVYRVQDLILFVKFVDIPQFILNPWCLARS